jgi:hypothetical protein
MRVCLSLALLAATAAATALLSAAALAGAVPALVLLERALMAPENVQ